MKIPLPRNLTTRLVFSHLLVGMVSIGLITIVAFSFIIEGGKREIRDNLTDTALNISNSLESPFLTSQNGQDFLPEIKKIIDAVTASSRGIAAQVLDMQGRLIYSSGLTLSRALQNQVDAQLKGVLLGKISGLSVKDEQYGEIFIALVPVAHLDEVYGALLLSIPYEPNLSQTRQSLILMLIIAWLVLIAVVLGAYLLAETINRPMRKLTQMAERMKKGDLAARVEISGPVEIENLSVTLNQMAAQLQDYLDGMRAFVANASHELRTPLTAMKLNTNALLSGALEDPAVSHRFLSQLEDEIDLMSRTVNDLLDLSRIEASRSQPMHEPVDLKAIIDEAAASFRNRAQAAELILKCITPASPVIILGNEDQLRRMLNNLLDNAIKNTARGGWVEAHLQPIGEQRIRLEVSDCGSGIPAEHLPRIFERFYRIEKSAPRLPTTGTGLGLAIVKSIVEAHHARIGVSSIVGKGTTFWIEFQGMYT